MLTIMALAASLAAATDDQDHGRRQGAGAAPTPLEALAPVFGNTLVSIYPDGRRAVVWLSRDGVYSGRGRKGGATSGVWRIRDDQVCFNQRRPIPLPVTYCTPIVAGGVGTRWPARSATGEAITVELVAGRGS